MEYWSATRTVGWKIAAYQKRKSGSASNRGVATATLRNAKTCQQLENVSGHIWMLRSRINLHESAAGIFTAVEIKDKNRQVSSSRTPLPARNACWSMRLC